MNIYLPDKTKKVVDDNSTAYDIAKSISVSLASNAICAKVNGELFDLNEVVPNESTFEVVTSKSKDALHVLNHSCAHLMAQAITHLYPGVNFAYGPATEEGFYYDVKFNEPFSENDFAKIEKEMQRIVSSGEKIERQILSYDEAKKVFKDQKYKLIHIDELNDKKATLSAYKQGDFIDLCLGPHMKSTSQIKAFKLLATSSSYFKGDKNNDSLTRIYGTAFFSKEDLDNYLKILEERKEADHKKIGRDMNLFMLSEYGPGMPFWLPNGMILKRELENYIWDLLINNGYDFVTTPQILSRELWEVSGHWKEYKQNMYTTKIENRVFAIKPMNCPGAILCYSNSLHSYKDLPVRLAEFGLVHRFEASGALNGLLRVREFTQDDAHIFLPFEDVEKEIRRLLKIFDQVYKVFNLDYHIEISTRPEEFVGKIETWNVAEDALIRSVKASKIPYEINPGDGAFYGPKIDFKLKDSLNRVWQCGTIQLDMQLPHRFNVSYIDSNNEKKEPVMIHRAIIGSFERFIAVVTEDCKGSYPTWLAPEQVRILPVNTDNSDLMKYVNNLNSTLLKLKIRSKVDDRNEKISYKIRESQKLFKASYTLVIGNNELENNTVTYRIHGHQETSTISKSDFIKKITKDIKSKSYFRTLD